jgi:hypothetical protein
MSRLVLADVNLLDRIGPAVATPPRRSRCWRIGVRSRC